MTSTLLHGDCLALLPTLAAGSVDAIVTDPPYELGFMGRAWDRTGIAYNVDLWREVYRVLKPGGHVVAFGGTRTYHRMACAIEDAGFEIRDQLNWLYGSGFPKSHDVSKALDGVLGKQAQGFNTAGGKEQYDAQDKSYRADYGYHYTPATDLAAQWAGWGTALKPSHEPIVLARKPLIGTVAANVAASGCGALNIDASRVGTELHTYRSRGAKGLVDQHFAHGDRPYTAGLPNREEPEVTAAGRWPPNLLLTHAPECNGTCAPDCPVAELDRQSGTLHSGGKPGKRYIWKQDHGAVVQFGQQEGDLSGVCTADQGGASRFYPTFRYVPKASRRERNAGCEGLPEGGQGHIYNQRPSGGLNAHLHGKDSVPSTNHHPTVKPVALLLWLCRLITPPGGVVLDPFTGSGSTGIAAVQGGYGFIGMEQDPAYYAIAQARIAAAHAAYQPALLGEGV